MNKYVVHPVPPTFQGCASRLRLSEAMSSGVPRATVISAPDGWGKTVFAAQAAQSTGGEVVWVDALGSRFNQVGLNPALHSISGSPSAERCETGLEIVCVIDDLCLLETDADRLLDLFEALAKRGARLIVTTNSPLPSAWRAQFRVFGPDDLRLTPVEAASICGLFDPGVEMDSSELENVMRESGGCVGLLVAVLSAVREDGVGAIARWFALRLSAIGEADVEMVARVAYSAAAQRATACRAHDEWKLTKVIPALDSSHGELSPRILQGLRTALLAHLADADAQTRRRVLELIMESTAASGDYEAMYSAVTELADDECFADTLVRFQEHFLRRLPPDRLRRDIESMPLHLAMEHAGVVVLWARVLYALGEDEDAANKARAAQGLAEAIGDVEVRASARVVLVDALCRMQRYEEAHELASRPAVGLAPLARLAEQVVAATVEMYVGHLAAASERLELARNHMSGVGLECHDFVRCRLATAVVDVLTTGEYSRLVPRVSSVLPLADHWMPDRYLARGNLGFGLMETGRLVRAKAMLSSVLESGMPGVVASFGVAQGCVAVAEGETGIGLRGLQTGCDAGARLSWDADMAVNRLYHSVALRALGRLDEALGQAERAYERLCVINYMGYRPLAALEVAASLLSLGDAAAARRWVANVEAEGFGENRYHALRAAMILAECDRVEGDTVGGVARLTPHTDHIVSESSNWQMAMYCRAFPGILGMLAASVGAARLPIHMLRMVLPEYAERGLRLARPWLELGEWQTMGRRLLGDTGFGMLERRNGEPICHVRLFGGLDVSVGDRMVTSRDWRKSKARLMFAMLVALRGREVPREQVLEYLWPDLPEQRARNNYYVAWSAMKLALMGQTSRSTKCPYVDNKGGRLRVAGDVLRSDIDEFEEALEQARDADTAGDSEASLAAYTRLSTVYRGELLPGDVYDDWFAPMRDHYQREFIDAMTRAAELLLENDDPCEALVFARRALSVDPLREDVYQVALRCHIAAGQRSGAIETFLQCRGRLAEDLGLDPSAETMQLYHEILVMEECPRYDDYGLS